MKRSESRTEAVACELLTIRGWNTARPPKGNVLWKNEYRDYPELLEQARGAIANIANKNTALHIFTPEDGSNYRQIDNFGLKHRVMFDWLDEVFDYRGK